MSLDFFVTHFYRLVVHDVVLMSDVYWFYTAGRLEGQSVQEFAEVLVGIARFRHDLLLLPFLLCFIDSIEPSGSGVAELRRD
jgi:hypothetical protein